MRLSVASILKGFGSHMEGPGAAGSRCNAPNGIEEGGAEIGFNPPERWAATEDAWVGWREDTARGHSTLSIPGSAGVL